MSLGGPEILVIIVIALLVLGPDKLPNAMRMLGKGYAEVKKYQNMAKNEIDKAIAMANIEEAAKETGDTEEKVEAVEEKILKKEKNKDIVAREDEDIVKPILDEES